MLFLRHPAWLWLKKFDKYKLPATDENTQDIFDTGHKFELYAEKLYPNAVRIGFNGYDEYQTLIARTNEALKKGVKTILQGGFEADGLTCIVDILNCVGDNLFDLIEVKSSTQAKQEHKYDLAYQTLVLKKCGIEINNIYIIHINNEYVRKGDIDPVGLTTVTDVTDGVKDLLEVTKEQVIKAKGVLSFTKMPDLSPRYVNQINIIGTTWFLDWLEIYKHLNPQLDRYSIYSLVSSNSEQIGDLEDNKIKLIKDIPNELTLKPKQLIQIKATKEDKRFINKVKIRKLLETFEYPLYFFDYETMSSAIPTFEGFQPYQDYPFQYSLHIQDSPNSEIRHLEYLHTKNSNPMPGLLKQLKLDIGEKGTVLTWNMTYEKSCNSRMGNFYPKYREFFDSLNLRISDLMIPFSEMWFVDKDFFGSASIKKVLPVMAVELNHKDLDISDGLKARRIWTKTIIENEYLDTREEILKNLSEYCTLDTYAMVRIFEELNRLVNR